MNSKAIVMVPLLAGWLDYATAQSYTVDWFKIAGGGGTSSNGLYTLSGTIGQLDARDPLTGGSYSLVGGFWALPMAVQTPGAPTLRILPAGPGFATISWSPAIPGCILQQSSSLTPPAWMNAPSGATNPVVVPALPPMRFYRVSLPQ